MKKVVDEKTGRKAVVFHTYNIGTERSCPECHRTMKDYDIKFFEENKRIKCSKCGAILVP